LNPVGIAVAGDKIVFIKQVQYAQGSANPNSRAVYYTNEGIVVSVFNRDLKNTGNLVVKRFYQVFIRNGEEVGFNISGNQLHLVYNVVTGVAAIGAQYALVDLDKLSLEKKTDMEKKGLSSDNNISAQTTLWLNNSFVLAYYRGSRNTGALLHAATL
jgi:hypothetical protein